MGRSTYFTMYSYNFCWPVRTLKTEAGEARTPAMAGGVDRSCVDARRVAEASRCSSGVGHDPSTGGRVKPLQRGTDQGPR